jgi:hypothetical protein
MDGNVKTISVDAPEYVIFADVRFQKRIDFAVFRKPLKKSKRARSGQYFILDSWQNDLHRKFDNAPGERLAHLEIDITLSPPKDA